MATTKPKASRPQVQAAPQEVATEATGAATGAAGGQPGPVAPTGAAAPGAATRRLPALPTTKTIAAAGLDEKTVLLYGPPGIGKSTLASQWGGGTMFFFDFAGELGDLEVFRGAITDWTSFREWGASYVQAQTGTKQPYGGCVIDTADIAGMMASDDVRKKHGILHESDLEWGKGWDQVKRTFMSALAKLQVSPGGVILVSHSKDVEIKTRSATYDKKVPTLTGGVREACVNTADLVLFIDWDTAGERRVIHTKPDRDHEAKERGQVPRLPAEIEWPIGTNGWELLQAAWNNDEKKKGASA